MDEIKKRFNKALSDFGMDRLIDESDAVVVGFSGGADSRVLLALMNDYVQERGKKIVCAHVNHMIRGDEADRDENNCIKWAQDCCVPIRVCRVNVPEIAKRNGTGIEETARNERYAFFKKVADETGGSSLIATAHNADDNLETVIFNFLRGSGTHGMAGIPPVRDGKYIRPLILCSSYSIRDYCSENGIPYNVDRTNLENDYTRNYIRNNIIPVFRNISNDPVEAAIRMCSVLRADDEFISSVADDFVNLHGIGTQSAELLRSLHQAVLSRVIDRLYRNAGGERTLSKVHVDSVIRAVNGKEDRVLLSLPDGITFSRSGNTVLFVNGSVSIERIDGVHPLSVDGEPFVFGDYALAVSSVPRKTITINENIYNLSIHVLTIFDKIKNDFHVRGRTEGDTYRFGRMTRKVKKLLSERKIPVDKRDTVPIVCDKDGIVWIPGFPLRDGVSHGLDQSAGNVYLCYYEKTDN